MGNVRIGHLLREFRWLVPCSIAIGICEGAMFAPLLLGPMGAGLGAVLWSGPVAIGAVLAGGILTLALEDVFAARRGRVPSWARLGIPQILLYVGGGLCVVVAGGLVPEGWQGTLLQCVGAALIGYCSAIGICETARFLARIKAEIANLCLVVSCFVMMLQLVVAACTRSLAVAFFLAALPALASFFFSRADARVPFECIEQPRHSGVDALSNHRSWANFAAMAAVAFYGVAVLFVLGDGFADTGVRQGTFKDALPLAAMVLSGLALLVVLLFFYAKSPSFSVSISLKVSVAVISAAAALAAAAPAFGSHWLPAVLAMALSVFGVVFYDQMVWMMSLSLMRSRGMREGVAVGFSHVGMLAGIGCAICLACVAPGDGSTRLAALFAATMLVLLVLVIGKPSREIQFTNPVPDAEPEPSPFEKYHRAIEDHGLTAREAEVFVRLMGGDAAPSIAEELCVSRATVNTHIRHIYAKFDVHSKGELADAVCPDDARGNRGELI